MRVKVYAVNLCFITFFIKQTSQTVLKCDSFSTISFYNTTEYLCETSSTQIAGKSDVIITEVQGTHEATKSNEQVTVLWIYDTHCPFFPHSIETFFPKLISVQIVNTTLSEIHRDDLNPLADLQFLMLTNNQIETIESNLFGGNKLLRFVDLSMNKIKTVDISAFDGLSDLTYLYFLNNTCENDSAQDDATAVKSLIIKICCSCR